jgi:hypothetical protein
MRPLNVSDRPLMFSTAPISRRAGNGLFNLVKSIPPTLNYEAGTIVADENFVIVHGRFSGLGQPVNWIAADILRIKDGILVEYWDVIQDALRFWPRVRRAACCAANCF